MAFRQAWLEAGVALGAAELGLARGGLRSPVSVELVGAAAVVVGGDGLDSVDPRPEAAEELQEIFGRGIRIGIRPAAGAPLACSLAGGRFFKREPRTPVVVYFCTI